MTKLTKDVECMEMIRRNLYLNKIRPFIDQDLIKVLIGLEEVERRSCSPRSGMFFWSGAFQRKIS